MAHWTGYGNLPEDSPQLGADTALSFRPDGMIRVYFHIEWDYMLDILSMISARVSCTRYRGQSISISKIVDSLPDQREECLDEEKNMLEAFFADVAKAINDVAAEVGSPDEARFTFISILDASGINLWRQFVVNLL